MFSLSPPARRLAENKAAKRVPQSQTGQSLVETDPLIRYGRGGGIRTRDPLHPMQVRYQAALHPD